MIRTGAFRSVALTATVDAHARGVSPAERRDRVESVVRAFGKSAGTPVPGPHPRFGVLEPTSLHLIELLRVVRANHERPVVAPQAGSLARFSRSTFRNLPNAQRDGLRDLTNDRVGPTPR